MRITNQKQYTVWIRPIGSNLWTINLKPAAFWSDRRLANNLASKIALKKNVCAIVRELDFPGDPDADGSSPYIQILNDKGRIEQFIRSGDFYRLTNYDHDRH